MSRPNRFIVHVKVGNRAAVCHIKNTGRCQRLLIPGATVILEFHPDVVVSGRETKYDLIGVYRNGLSVNVNPQAPNKTVWEWLALLGDSMDGCGCTEKTDSPFSLLRPCVPCDIRREVAHGDSRFDLAFSLRDRGTKAVSPAFIGVKGVALEENGVATLPDTPTERGIKHSKGLIRTHEGGYEAYVLLVIQMKGIRGFTPNGMTRPVFGDVLRQAHEAGVHMLAYDCLVTLDTMIVDSPVKVILDQNTSQYTLLTLRVRASPWEALAAPAFILNNIIPKLQVF